MQTKIIKIKEKELPLGQHGIAYYKNKGIYVADPIDKNILILFSKKGKQKEISFVNKTGSAEGIFVTEKARLKAEAKRIAKESQQGERKTSFKIPSRLFFLGAAGFTAYCGYVMCASFVNALMLEPAVIFGTASGLVFTITSLKVIKKLEHDQAVPRARFIEKEFHEFTQKE